MSCFKLMKRATPCLLRSSHISGFLLAMLMSTLSVAEDSTLSPISNHTYSLSELVDAALYRNPAIPGKRSEIEAKQFYSDSARAGRYPSVSLQAGYVTSQYDAKSYNERTLSLQAKQPLWAFGRIDASIDYAEADVRVQQADLVRISRDLVDKTVNAYLQLVAINRRQDVWQSNIQILEKLYQQINSRFEGNLASKADVDLAYLRLLQAQSDVNKLEGERLLVVTDLQSLTQLPVTQVASVAPEFIHLPAEEVEIEEQVLLQSADLTFRMRQLDLAKSNTQREASAMMPTLYLQASKELNDLNSRNGEQVGLMFEASLDGLGLYRSGLSKAAKAQEYSALEGLNVARNELLRTVRNLVHTRQTQGDMRRAVSDSVNSFQSISDSYIRQYITGKKTWLDVLNIQKEMTLTQLEFVQVETDWYLASLRLMVLLGKLDSSEKVIGSEDMGYEY